MTRVSRRLTLAGFAALGLVALCGGLYAARAALLPAAAHWLDVGETPCRAECALVLGGDENSRPFVAAALWKAGFAKKILLTRPESAAPDDEAIYPSFQQISRGVLLARGVAPADIVLLGEGAATTFDESQSLRAYVERNAVRRVLLVTNDYHTRRARWIFRKALSGTGAELVVISAPPGRFSSDNWWRYSLGFRLILSEYFKLAFYAVRYGGWGYAIVAAVAVLALGVAWRRSNRIANCKGPC